MPDITTLRERLLAWPRFAYCFDGIAVDWRAVCDTDPNWLNDHAEWFRRHGIRFLVDARAADAESLRIVAARLAGYGKGAELLTGEVLDSLRASATQSGFVLRTPDQVRFLEAGSMAKHGGNLTEVLEGDWRSWDCALS